MNIRLAAPLQMDSIVDGEGIRTVLWTQGCSHQCKGCHNPGTHSFTGGYLEDIEVLKKELQEIDGQDGITFSGGDPFFQIEACLELATFCHSIGLNVWCYTGYTFEQLLVMSKSNQHILSFLEQIDVLVDGKFILEERSLDLKYKGSKNQRILDVSKSLERKEAIEIPKYQGLKESGNIYSKPEYLYI